MPIMTPQPLFRSRLIASVQGLLLTILLTTSIATSIVDRPSDTPSSPPQMVQAGWPVFDISNLITAMQQFVQIKQQIDTARETYQAIRQDFEIISNLTGIDAINDWFAPIDAAVLAYDDFTRPLSDAVILYDALFPGDPQDYDGNLGDAWEYASEAIGSTWKDQILQASVNAENLRQTMDRLNDLHQCADNARGSLQIERCAINLGLIQAHEISTLKAQIIRQGMYTALRGNNDYLTQRHRRDVWAHVLRRAQEGTLAWTDRPPRKAERTRDIGGDHH